MSSEIYTSSFNRRLPKEIFETKIIPLLLDEKDPTSIATLSQVCHLWNQVMKSEEPFIEKLSEPGFLKRNPEIAALKEVFQSDRKAYVSRFQKSLFEKMQIAYQNCRENTSNFEAKFLFPLSLGLPFSSDLQILIGEYLGMNAALIPPMTFALSAIPTNLDFRTVHFNHTAGKIGIIALSSSIFFALSYLIGSFYDRNCSADLKEPFLLSFYTFTSCVPLLAQVEGDSLLTKTYRVGKASLAACVPVANKLSHSIRQIFFKPQKQ